MLIENARARRLFLAAHALADPPSGAAPLDAVEGLIQRLGFVQIDSIATVARAHHMILWSRRNAYRPAMLDALLARRSLFEHWTHDAAILPMEFHPHWHHRFAAAETRLEAKWDRIFRPGFRSQFDAILARIRAEGPLSVSDVGAEEVSGQGGWWDWKPSKTALEWLWMTGKLAITRRDAFRKVYDLTERVIPEAHRHATSRADLVDWACSAALTRLGFADARQLRAFWHLLTPQETRDWIEQALARGEIIPLRLQGADGSTKAAFARPDALEAPEPPSRIRILSPFDPALRDRDRAEFLFGFRYRIEVFTPAAKRTYGYYVFPLLEGARLIGRLDAALHRPRDALHLRALWLEPGQSLTKARQAKIEAELARLAAFAGVSHVTRAADWQRQA